MDLIAIFKTFHPNAEEYIFFSNAHRTFSRTDHILGHKSSSNKSKKIEIISSIFSDHNAMRLDTNYRGEKCKKNTNMWLLNDTLLNNKEVTKEIRREIKRFLETNDKKKQQQDDPKPMGFSKSSCRREVYSNIILLQET